MGSRPVAPRGPAQARFESLPAEATREEYFGALRAATAEHYLAEPGNPYRESGRSSGAARWEETRRLLAEPVDRDGHFMDVGCANGLLLETLAAWCLEKGVRITPHGIDFVPELVALARARHAAHADSFEVANVWEWQPRRRYDFVRLSVEIVRAEDRLELVRRVLARAVAPGGCLIATQYRNEWEDRIDVAALLAEVGQRAVGTAQAPGVEIAWT